MLNTKIQMLDTLVKIRELIEQNRALERRNEELKNIIDINLTKKAGPVSLNPTEILSKQEIENLVFNFFQKIKIPATVYDINGNLLFSIGSKKLCKKINQLSESGCFVEIADFLKQRTVEKYFHFQCLHRFNSLAFPIEVRNNTIGVLILSQFFIHGEIPGFDLFSDLLNETGININDLTNLIEEIPVYKKSEIDEIIHQGSLLTEMISFIANKNIEFYTKFNQQLENEQIFTAIKHKIAEQEELIHSLLSKITQHHDYVQDHTVPKTTLKKEIKSINTKLEQTETILNSILTTTPLGIVFIKKNTITYANDQIFQLTGYTIKEIIGRNLGYFIEETEIIQKISNLTNEEFINKDKTHFEVTIIRKDKQIKKAYLFVSPFDINNPFNGYTVSFLDISDTKRIQDEMILAKEKAEESDRLKNAFLLNMSHEIRTPLNAIVGFTSLLNSDEISEQQKTEYISIIDNSCKRLMRMIDDIIDMSYISTNQIKIQHRKFSVYTLMNDIYESFNDYIKEKYISDIRLKLTIPVKENPGSMILYNDEIRLSQIITSLLRNSFRFTQHGEVEFGYELTTDGNIKFFIKDTGEGISADKLPNIFGFYDHLPEESYTRQFSGTSLGLFISKKYIESMGGKIWAESEHKKGTNILFTLPGPISNEIKKNNFINEKPVKSKHDWSNKTILVAEDEELNFILIKKILNHTNVNLKWAENGQKAIDTYENNPDINLILMDIKMPILNGIEATRQIKLKNKNIPVIAQTAYIHDENKKAIMEAGCDEFIPKPLNPEFFVSVLEKFLNNN